MADRKIPKRKQNIYVVFAVLGVVGVLAGFSRLPSPPPGEAALLASHFKLDWQNLPPAPMPEGGVVSPIVATLVLPCVLAIKHLLPGKRAHKPHTSAVEINIYWGFERVLLIKESQ